MRQYSAKETYHLSLSNIVYPQLERGHELCGGVCVKRGYMSHDSTTLNPL